jgi:hypothetical protein
LEAQGGDDERVDERVEGEEGRSRRLPNGYTVWKHRRDTTRDTKSKRVEVEENQRLPNSITVWKHKSEKVKDVREKV